MFECDKTDTQVSKASRCRGWAIVENLEKSEKSCIDHLFSGREELPIQRAFSRFVLDTLPTKAQSSGP
jgi:hypothetical protein